MIALQTYIPKNIQHIVKSFWFLEVESGDGFYEEDIIPDAHHEIILHVNGQSAKRKTAHEAWVDESNAIIAAQTVTSYRLRMFRGAKLYGIRFYPHTLYSFLGIPLHLFNDKAYSLQDVLDKQPFYDCITDDPHQTFLNFEQLLLRKINSLQPESRSYQYVQASMAAILKRNGHVAVDELIRKTGISGKHLDNLFEKYVGLGPKTISRIVQLNHFISYKSSQPAKTLTDCAYECGYYDQAHIIKSFRQFAGISPKNYFKNSSFINDFFAQL
jgi:AraC-like DNA-binding protein